MKETKRYPMSKSYAIVTGGSSGLGFEFAKLLAADGYDLLIGGHSNRVKQSEQELHQLGVHVIGVQADLSTAEGTDAFWQAAIKKERPIDVAVLNAGISLGGNFQDIPLDEHLRVVAINITSIVRLTYFIVPHMIKHGGGKILLVSSLSATTPTPYESVYGPTKAFLSSFGHGLREELLGTNVQITILHPGATATEFHARAGMDSNAFTDNSWKNDPKLVAHQGYQGLIRGQTSLVGGDAETHRAWNEQRILPEEEKARRFALMARPR